MSAKPIDPPNDLPPPPRFGDPAWIAHRGPLRDRKYRFRRKQSKKSKRGAPIWQRIEGEWKRKLCECGASTFWILNEDGAFVELRCVAGHETMCLAGFATEKPADG